MLQGLWQPSGKLFLSRLVPIDNARPLLLGNIANLFLDEWIHAGEEEPDYIDCMKKAFRQYPIELAACAELRDPSKEKEFAKDCRMHFEHIRDVVQHTFWSRGIIWIKGGCAGTVLYLRGVGHSGTSGLYAAGYEQLYRNEIGQSG